jgi:hypothetical protein
MSDISAAAELLQGAASARAVEPAHGEAGGEPGSEGGHFAESECLNCGTPLIGRHCHNCGQAAHVHRSLGAFFHDLLHGVFHFEGKIWRTLPMLTFRPGQLTREYIDGRRASYVSPIALFLFVVFLTFAAYSLLGGSLPAAEAALPQDAGSDFAESFDEAAANSAADIKRLEAELASARTAGMPTAALEEQLATTRRIHSLMAGTAADPGNLTELGAAGSDAAVSGWLEQAWHKARADPALLAYKLQANAYKFSWLLIPISVPFVWLLFPFSRRFHIYDHTIFVTYSIAFMLGLVLLTAVLGAFSATAWLAALPVLAMPLHLYRHMKGTYGLGRVSALLRSWCLLWFAFFALLLFSLVLVTLAL